MIKHHLKIVAVIGAVLVVTGAFYLISAPSLSLLGQNTETNSKASVSPDSRP